MLNQQDATLSENYRTLIAKHQSLLLSTTSTTNTPEISYAPYVRDQPGVFYIYISELASHTINLLANPQASIMFIQDESEAKNQFARERVIFQCTAVQVDRSSPQFHAKLAALQEKFGDTVALLRSLSDFHLFELSAINGRYIAGFGKAYNIDIKNSHISASN